MVIGVGGLCPSYILDTRRRTSLADPARCPNSSLDAALDLDTMASRTTSPGGALLRASRIFAIPSPLPRPMPTVTSHTSASPDSATIQHPIHLTITTPQTSLARGDWGFKRPLPLRTTTKTSTPLIRVSAIDAYEQVTDYASAADHTLTLKKWEEMGVPLLTPPIKSRTALGYAESTKRGQRSVFEDSIDSTVRNDRETDESRDQRWRFDGPWIAGLTEGDFDTYVTKQVRGRRVEFMKYLRTVCAGGAAKAAQRIAVERGEEVTEIVEVPDVTDEQFRKYLKTLRHDRIYLYRHIRRFLDLPPSPNMALQGGSEWLSSVFDGGAKKSIDGKDLQPNSDSPYADSGPPKTHPSAGLSYGHTSAHTFNHPLYGPQNKRPPVQARVVMPKGASGGNATPVLGVGGFVVDTPSGATSTSFNLHGSRRAGPDGPIPGLINVEPNKVGGSKTYVHPRSASIDSEGRVLLKVDQADPEAVAVLEGNVDDIPRQQIMHTKGFARKPLRRSTGGYGLSSGDLGERKQ